MSVTVRRVAFWSFSAAWAGFIFFMSSIPGSKIPGTIPAPLAHFSEYFVFAVLLFLALLADVPARKALVLAVAIASAYGVTDEFHQRFVVMRTPDVWDWVTDTAGALAGAGIALGVALRRVRERQP